MCKKEDYSNRFYKKRKDFLIDIIYHNTLYDRFDRSYKEGIFNNSYQFTQEDSFKALFLICFTGNTVNIDNIFESY
ncbi:hypothetical protein GCM10011445_19680 [Pseudocitrobacter faecalis]|nr:hypothetical protein GCM10011445_19680 [Pseudocitrobacter faecalis]